MSRLSENKRIRIYATDSKLMNKSGEFFYEKNLIVSTDQKFFALINFFRLRLSEA